MGPPALLMVSEYPALFPWYEGGIRVAMNLLGSAIVISIVFGIPKALTIKNRLALRRGSDPPT